MAALALLQPSPTSPSAGATKSSDTADAAMAIIEDMEAILLEETPCKNDPVATARVARLMGGCQASPEAGDPVATAPATSASASTSTSTSTPCQTP
jgi:hypothetical protein